MCVMCACQNPDYRMTLNEHTEFENLCTITLTTQASRDEQNFPSYEVDQFAAMAHAVGVHYSIQLTEDLKGLEFLYC